MGGGGGFCGVFVLSAVTTTKERLRYEEGSKDDGSNGDPEKVTSEDNKGAVHGDGDWEPHP